jgi:hypothetical protein
VSTPDPFGDAVDADTIEDALRASIQKWLPAWLAHEERRRGWPRGRLPQPRSWPTLSEFELRARDQRPSVVLVSSGTTGAPEKRPDGLRRTWQFGLAVAIAGRDEAEARQLAAPYLTAAAMAATTDKTLGGVVENVRWSGADDHAFDGEQGSQTAIYGTDLEVTARSAYRAYVARDPDSGVLVPPLDPYSPPGIPPLPDTSEITVDVVADDATP